MRVTIGPSKQIRRCRLRLLGVPASQLQIVAVSGQSRFCAVLAPSVAADGREQLQVGMQYVNVFANTDGPAENAKIINDHGKKGSEYAQEDAEFQGIFFKHQNFQDFSSLVFKT